MRYNTIGSVPTCRSLEVVYMSRKHLPFDTHDVLYSYSRGESMESIARRYHSSNRTIRAFLVGSGVAIKPSSHTLPDAEIIARYLAGDSELALARAYGVERIAIRRRILNAGIQPRGVSEANRIRMQRLSPNDRSALAAAAHAAVRGKPRTDSELATRARTSQQSGRYIGRYEQDLVALLRVRGLEPIAQHAEGRYNIDIAIHPIAVEVHTQSAMPLTVPAIRPRIVELLKRGWIVIYVWIDRRSKHPLSPRAADDILALYQRAQIDPTTTFRRSYRVIRGSGYYVTAGYLDSDDLTLIPASIHPLDFTCWDDERRG